MPTRCCIPPDSSSGRRLAKPASPTISSSSCARSRSRSDTWPVLWRTGKTTLSSTVAQGSRVGFWNTMPMSSRGPVTGIPKTSTPPVVGQSSPAIIRSSVDLPQPEGPRMARNS